VISGSQTLAFTGIAYDTNNNVITPTPAFTWNVVSISGTASIASSGIATGQKIGTVTITATNSSITSNSLTLTINASSGVISSIIVSGGSSNVTSGNTSPIFLATAYDANGNTLEI
jgi:hypothetical protein